MSKCIKCGTKIGFFSSIRTDKLCKECGIKADEDEKQKAMFVAPVMDMAYEKYSLVMSASRKNSFYSEDKENLNECISLLDQVILIYTRYGEPYGMRGNMYFIRGQLNSNSSDLDKAIHDFNKGLAIGAKDISNHAIWKNSINQLKTLKKTIY